MKPLQLASFAIGFAFIAVCALLAARSHRPAAQPQPSAAAQGGAPANLMTFPAPMFTPEAIFAARDANHDGKVTCDEYIAGFPGFFGGPDVARRYFLSTDADHDGVVTLQEMKDAFDRFRRSAQEMRQQLADAIADRGYVTLDEATAGKSADEARFLQGYFQQMDADRDGKVTQEELSRRGFRPPPPQARGESPVTPPSAASSQQ